MIRLKITWRDKRWVSTEENKSGYVVAQSTNCIEYREGLMPSKRLCVVFHVLQEDKIELVVDNGNIEYNLDWV